MMLERLEQILRQHKLVTSGDKLLVAVSGGADSMALLHLLSRLAPSFPCALMVAHLDHQLRSASSADADFVIDYCEQENIPVVVEKIDVAALSQDLSVGLEEAGRHARRKFLLKVAAEHACSAIVLAHHGDDQAETLLFRLLRGSGLSGLAAMRMKNGLFIRPLLTFRSSALKDYLQQQDIAWCEDASNADISFTRNKIRHHLLPQLQEYNPQVVDALRRLSQQATDEDEYWTTLAAGFLAKHGRCSTDGFEVDIKPLLLLGRAERSRILRAFLQQLHGYLAGVEAGHIAQIEDLLMAGRPQADLHLPGIWVARRYDRLLCSTDSPEIPDYEISISGPGEYQLPTGDRLLFLVGNNHEVGACSALFSADHLSFPLTVRSPRPGDRFQPSGMTGRKLLKDYFIDAKIDRESRLRTPVVCHADEIIWLAGHRRCEGFHPVPDGNLLKIILFRQNQSVE